MSATREARAHDFTRRPPAPARGRPRPVGRLGALVARGLGRAGRRGRDRGVRRRPRGGPWGRPRADLDPQAGRDHLRSTSAPCARRPAAAAGLVARGPMRVAFRARAMVRSSLGAFASGVPVPRCSWTPDRGTGTCSRSRPPPRGRVASRWPFSSPAVVAGAHAGRPEILVDEVTLESSQGMVLAWPVLAWLATARSRSRPVARAGPRADGLAAAAAARWSWCSLRPARWRRRWRCRAWFRSRWARGSPRRRPILLRRRSPPWRPARPWRGPGRRGRAARASLPFFPDHNPPDLQTHVGRTLDFAECPGIRCAAALRLAPAHGLADGRAGHGPFWPRGTLSPTRPMPYLVLLRPLHGAGRDPPGRPRS